jgi:hypothetical protein
MSRNLKLLFLSVLGLTAWFILLSRGKPVPKGAYGDPEGGFALVPPAGWLMLTSANLEEALAVPGLRLTEDMRGHIADGRVAVSFLASPGPAHAVPSINVLRVDERFPRLDPSSSERLAASLQAHLAEVFAGYRPGPVESVDVDGIRSLRLLGEAVVGSRRSPIPVRLVHVLVRGAGKSYLIVFQCPVDRFPAYGPAFEEALASFRVLRRPPLL